MSSVMIDTFIPGFRQLFPGILPGEPWHITAQLTGLLHNLVLQLDSSYIIENDIAVHVTAVVEQGCVLKGPVIIGPGCRVGAHAYLRGGVWLAESARVGPACEIKASIIGPHSAVAHFNFIGDSIIGSRVNFEAGAVTANHQNERADKRIWVQYGPEPIDTGVDKFGALVGDDARIGANAVLSPGTLLLPGTVVKRLELIEQVK